MSIDVACIRANSVPVEPIKSKVPARKAFHVLATGTSSNSWLVRNHNGTVKFAFGCGMG
jgi:hypothetical protein